MTTALHKDLPISEVHTPIAFEYANQTAREAATGLTTNDVRKFSRQIDDNSLWLLISYSPVLWVAVGTGGGSTAEYVFVTALKASAGTIVAGTPVYFATCSGLPEVESAKADSSSTMPAIGITASAITDIQSGLVILRGRLAGIDTSGYTIGNDLYVSATTAGVLTSTRPTGASLVQNIALVAYVDASNGSLCVHGDGLANDLPNLAQGKVWVGDSDGHPVEQTAIFGTHYDEASSEGDSSHTGDVDWEEKLTKTFNTLPDGKYRIGFYYEWKYNDASAAWFGGRIQINNVTTPHEIYQEPKDATNWYSESGFMHHTVSSGPENVRVDIDYKTYRSGATAYIRKARVEIWRVS